MTSVIGINQPQKRVCIVIVNYKGWLDTIECLESVLKNDFANFSIVVVDNDSADGSFENLLEWAEGSNLEFPKINKEFEKLSRPPINKPIKYVEFDGDFTAPTNAYTSEKFDIFFMQAPINGGFAYGNNLGLKFALSYLHFDYAWLLNNDTVIPNNCLSQLVNCAEQENYGITGSVLYYYNTPEVVQAYAGKVDSFFGTSSHITQWTKGENQIDYIVGASMLIGKEVINEVGLLPEDYFLYFEECDYCYSAKKAGVKLGVSLSSSVFHKEGASTGSNVKVTEKSEFSDILSIKNRIRFHKKFFGGGIGLWLGLFIAILNRVKRGQWNRALSILKLSFK